MSIGKKLREWWQVQTGEDETPFDGDSPAFLVSMLFHLGLLITLGLWPLLQPEPPIQLTITAPDLEVEEELVDPPMDVVWSSQPSEEVGAQSEHGDMVALSMAPVLAEVSEIPQVTEMTPVDSGQIEFNANIVDPTGLTLNANHFVRGAAGEGTTGASGAVDRITKEILLSLEERKTLVVWLFDQSGSLSRQRSAIKERFDKIYDELGVIEASGNPAFKRYEDKPLLTSVVAFGEGVNMITEKPTDNITEIKEAVDKITQDDSGVERVFSAIYMAAKQHTTYRIPREGEREPERNVMLVAFTDEAGDDVRGLDDTIRYCRRFDIPVYVVGVPAPFGRKETLVKWVDPDPEYDQRPQWGEVDQGPESFLPERIKISFSAEPERDAPIDSGFGPFALTRLAYETGGIYFAVHPNRNVSRAVSRGETAAYSAHIEHFFDPNVMRRYRPDYVSQNEYMRRVNASKARTALVTAATQTWIRPMDKPELKFVKRSEAELATDMFEAQKAAASLTPKINQLYDVIKLGEADREQEASPRWQAGFDLAMGRVAAIKVRTETYNAMLARAKTGMKFQDPKNNTWVLKGDDDVSVGSQHENMAKKAKMYLQRVIDEHPGTPWALLAERELAQPLSWKWTEEFTDLSPPGNNAGNNNNNNNPANDKKKMMQRPPKKRPAPKL
ncbi:MAG: VWA domain-containing protein [Planctomycetales bacterium]|nr:VWA domain-containing protein [Planctomycetales bacterium]